MLPPGETNSLVGVTTNWELLDVTEEIVSVAVPVFETTTLSVFRESTMTFPNERVDGETENIASPDSPIAKSLKLVIPVACVLNDVRVPVVGVDQFGELYFFTIKLSGFEFASISSGTNVNVAL